MKVLALKPGHDGAVAYLDDRKLIFSLESEKDSFARHAGLSAPVVFDALQLAPETPDVLAIGGWHKILPGSLSAVEAGYRGLTPGHVYDAKLFGAPIKLYSSSHERSHVIGGVAMAPFNSSEPMAVLVWEGVIGSFYLWQGPHREVQTYEVLDQPGARFAALFALAEPSFPDAGEFPPSEYAGKLMALAGWSDDVPPTTDSRDVVDSLLRTRALYPFHKALYRRADLYNLGVATPELCRSARYLTDQIYDVYLESAKRILPTGLPLVISGGCGLNCEWNARWRACGHFREVFVPPCADDSGSAIGSAVDAALQLGDPCELQWDVYAGPAFIHDADPVTHGWTAQPVDYAALSDAISADRRVVAWIQGRCEIGPRALGNRSLLASAADAESHARLNRIKQRESYRPIAPVCLEEDLAAFFDSAVPDPHMLFFRRVLHPGELPAVTHADGSARVQSVNRKANPPLYELLLANRTRHGIGVFCNTSLNFKGRGFINRTSELLHYCDLVGIADVVIDAQWYRTNRSTTPSRALVAQGTRVAKPL